MASQLLNLKLNTGNPTPTLTRSVESQFDSLASRHKMLNFKVRYSKYIQYKNT